MGVGEDLETLAGVGSGGGGDVGVVGVAVRSATDFGVSVGSWLAVGEASCATCFVEGEG